MNSADPAPRNCDFASAAPLLKLWRKNTRSAVLALQWDCEGFFDTLTTWMHADCQPNRQLDYTVICESPPSADALQIAFQHLKKHADWIPELIAQWPSQPEQGFHSLTLLAQHVRLTLIVYPHLKALVELQTQADVIFMGVAQDAPVQHHEASLLACASAAIRNLAPNGLIAAHAHADHAPHWLIEKSQQLGLVLQMQTSQIAWFAIDTAVQTLRPQNTREKPVERIAIVGAGIAGLSLALALARRAKLSAQVLHIDVLEAKPRIFQAASAAPLILLHPASGSRDSIEFNLQSHSFRSAVRQLLALHRAESQSGWMHAMPVHELRKNGRSVWHQGYVLNPKGLSEALLKALADCQVRVHVDQNVSFLKGDLRDGFSIEINGTDTLTADAVYLCNATAAQSLLSDLVGLIDPVRGQLELISNKAVALDFSYCGALNVLPGAQLGLESLAIGNSFEPFKSLLIPDADVKTDLLIRAQALLGVTALFAHHQSSWVGIRAQSSDRKPLVGRLPSGIGLSLAHGSKGFSSGFLAAEMLTASHFGDAQIVPERVRLAVAPERFTVLDPAQLG